MSQLQRTKKSILLVINNSTFFSTLHHAVERLKLKASRQDEFGEIEVIEINATPLPNEIKKFLTDKLLENTFLCFCDYGIQWGVADLFRERRLIIPVGVLLPKFTTENIEKVYEHPYLYTFGFFHQDTQDPQTIGEIIKTVKEEFRRINSLKLGSKTKKLGWLIKRTSNKQIFASLFLDARMRNFMQQLLFVVESVYQPSMPKPALSLASEFKRLFDANPSAQDYTQLIEQNEQEAKSLFSDEGRIVFKPQPILLQGETGVGKTLVAKRIHQQLVRFNSDIAIPFQQISTVNVGKNIIEPELFGVVRGAWTGAVTRPGKLLMGRGGVVFLDEIGELPLEIQSRFLTYLDSFEFQPDGWHYEWKIWSPVYVVAATNVNLKEAVEKGNFRRDLFHRFTHKLQVPALRERRADIRALIDVILQNEELNKEKWVEEITLSALARLENYDFPGNFRELEAILSRAVFKAVQAGRRVLREEDLEF